MADLLRHLMLERGMWEEYFDQAKVDVRSRPIEMEIGELFVDSGGLLIDERGATNVPGLYGGGECAGAGGLARASVDGHRAGVHAAQYAAAHDGVDAIDERQVQAAGTQISRMRTGGQGPTYRELEETVRAIMAHHVNLDKDEAGLRVAVEQLEALRPMAEALTAHNQHEALRGLEAKSALEFAILIAAASKDREGPGEQLGGAGALFWRTDRANGDVSDWERLVTIQQQNGRRVVRLEPVPD